MKKLFTYIIVCAVTLILILNPDKSVYYARNALLLCAEIIIPSLFPFFVCSGLLIYSGFCEILAKLFSPVMKPLFNVNSSGAAAFVLGIISGYPLGAVTACQLYRGMYISKTEAERLLCFCNNSGPLFIMGAVGVSMYHSTRVGIVLYIAHILGAFTVGILSRFYRSSDFCAPRSTITLQNTSSVFSSAVSNSIQSILTVCATVVFCSVISSLVLDMISVNSYLKAMINGVCEFVSGLDRVSALDSTLMSKLLISAWICAFAGISVHLQVMGVVGDSGLSLKPYVFGKFLHGLFSVLYTYIILRLMPISQTVFSFMQQDKRISAGFYISSGFCVTCVALIAVLSVTGLIFKFKKSA